MTGLSPLRLGLTADVKTYCERSNFILIIVGSVVAGLVPAIK